MLEKLTLITSTEPYRSYGGFRIKELSITLWEKPQARLIIEIVKDEEYEVIPPFKFLIVTV